ncbi:50S ribosomal protein L11 methyltransferase [Sphingobacteriales bacterium UPWRP_1]|nr:ribosomal protein L11 methyltransferase [Sphingobacteriales bacterium TSM_CSM]PSJ72066.1 50S ribosomal protein L11 methyltransferase [Sphingobacteriales bacterium UPWRP_1]
MAYTVIEIAVSDEALSELIVEKLASIGFDGFELHTSGIKAYIPTGQFKAQRLHKAIQAYNKQGAVAVTAIAPLEEKNWNEEWERNFEPVVVENRILIRAPFHAVDGLFDYTLTIEPKMAFGTGHHETTYLMLREMLQLDFGGKKVLDFGCGTGILAMMAAKLGAAAIVAIDNDEWAYRNTPENMEVNEITGIEVRLGTHTAILPHEQFHCILANINRNVILETLPVLRRALLPGGCLLVSGILTTDVAEVETAAQHTGLRAAGTQGKGNWAQITFYAA